MHHGPSSEYSKMEGGRNWRTCKSSWSADLTSEEMRSGEKSKSSSESGVNEGIMKCITSVIERCK